MLTGDFSVRIQSWDKPVPPAKLSVDEKPVLGYDFLRSDIGQRQRCRVERHEDMAERGDIVNAADSAALGNHMAKEESSISTSEEMKDNWHKEKKDGWGT